MQKFDDLVAGYHRFRRGVWEAQQVRWSDLSAGQDPKILVIGCSDSRVDPSQIFDSRPGEVFVVRNVAALVPPFETTPGRHGVSAALEFAVQVLKVSEIVVLGHGLCGGCKVALSQELRDAPPGEGGFIAAWISLLDDARVRVVSGFGSHGPEAERAMEQEAVKTSLANLRTFPCIREKEAAGDLNLHGAVFAIADGALHVLDEHSGTYSPA